jgi:hypothetical protein
VNTLPPSEACVTKFGAMPPMFRAARAGIATDAAMSPRTIILLIKAPLCIMDANILYFWYQSVIPDGSHVVSDPAF